MPTRVPRVSSNAWRSSFLAIPRPCIPYYNMQISKRKWFKKACRLHGTPQTVLLHLPTYSYVAAFFLGCHEGRWIWGELIKVNYYCHWGQSWIGKTESSSSACGHSRSCFNLWPKDQSIGWSIGRSNIHPTRSIANKLPSSFLRSLYACNSVLFILRYNSCWFRPSCVP